MTKTQERIYRLAKEEESARRPRWDKIVAWWREAATLGSAEAQAELAMCYRDGFCAPDGRVLIRRSPVKARELYALAAKGGNVDGIVGLAYCWYVGLGGKTSKARALKLYRRAAAHGSFIAAYNISAIYRDLGDRAARIRWLKRIADLGDIDALLELGQIYIHGKARATTRRIVLRQVAKIARSPGEWRSEAVHLLADAYELGAGVKRSRARASRLRSSVRRPGS